MSRINFLHRIGFLAVGLSLLNSCSAIIKDPVYHSVMRDFKSEDLNDEIRSYQIGWLAQALLEPGVRPEIAAKLVENASLIESQSGFTLSNAADASLTAQMLTDVATGQLGSGLGDSIGAAVFIGATALSLFSGDGSINTTNVVLLPTEMDGKTLTSKEVAKAAAQQLILNRYSAAAKQFGYSFVCEYSCEAFPSLYRMQQNTETDTSRFIYAAKDIAIYFEDFDLVAAGSNNMIDSVAAGFNVAWRSNFNNEAAIFISQNPRLDAQGKIQIVSSDKALHGWTFYADPRFVKTDFGDAVLREVYNSPYMLFGTADNYPSVAYYDGAVYRYVLNSKADTFNELILPFHQ